jgi:L-serine dehydratase
VVTAPTNGACGTVPAVLYYYLLFHAPDEEIDWLTGPDDGASSLNPICKFLLVANAVGGIVKANSNISGGVGGCQAEVGTACAMAAGGLTDALGGDPAKVFQAAEAALESHLGSTCDPIGGLVEIPCIERNLTAAVTAVSVSFEIMALETGFETVVPFDNTVLTMQNISDHMDSVYKETSKGGLAKTMLEDVKAARPDLFPPGVPSTADRLIPVSHTTC